MLVVLSIPFGLEINPGGLVVSFLLLALVGPVMSPFSCALAIILGNEDALAPAINGIALPLMLLPGMMLPMTLAPDWLQTIAPLNPIYHAVSAVRDLFDAQLADPEVLTGTVVMAALAGVMIWLGARTFGRAAL